jgi:hypothetical protein
MLLLAVFLPFSSRTVLLLHLSALLPYSLLFRIMILRVGWLTTFESYLDLPPLRSFLLSTSKILINFQLLCVYSFSLAYCVSANRLILDVFPEIDYFNYISEREELNRSLYSFWNIIYLNSCSSLAYSIVSSIKFA